MNPRYISGQKSQSLFLKLWHTPSSVPSSDRAGRSSHGQQIATWVQLKIEIKFCFHSKLKSLVLEYQWQIFDSWWIRTNDTSITMFFISPIGLKSKMRYCTSVHMPLIQRITRLKQRITRHSLTHIIPGRRGNEISIKENFCFSGINKVKKYYDRKTTKRSKYIFMIMKNKRRRNLILIMKLFYK